MPQPPAGGDDELTLNEVAEFLGVHYMTAYRYLRIGKLPARREGRVWRVKRNDAEALLAGRDQPDSGTADQRNAGPDRARLLVERLLSFDERGAWSLIEGAMVSGADPIRIHTELVSPALSELGCRWAEGQIDIGREHAATTICRNLIGRLSLTSSRPGSARGLVIFVGAPGDQHVLPATIAADIFRASGFDVVDCGSALPPQALGDLVADVDRLTAVGISTTMPGNRSAIRAMVNAIRASRPEVTILVGGAAVPELGGAAAVGADHVVVSALAGVALLNGDTPDEAGGERPSPDAVEAAKAPADRP
ncbi:MAG: cobalamin-dependent protein [Actinomycetota bacterium]